MPIRRDVDVPGRFKARWLRNFKFIEGVQQQITHIFRDGNQAANFMMNANGGRPIRGVDFGFVLLFW